MGVKFAVVILMCPLLAVLQRDKAADYFHNRHGWGAPDPPRKDRPWNNYYEKTHPMGRQPTPQRDRISEYYARPLGWGGGASHLDRGSYYSGSHRSGSSETQVSRGSYGSGYPGMGLMGTGMLGTGLGTGLYGGRGYYSGGHSAGMSSISSTRCMQTRAAKDTAACEANLENEVKKIPKGSPDYNKKVCCLAASADKCHERATRAVGCEHRILTHGTRSRPWLQQYIGSQNCGSHDCGTRISSSVHRTGYSSGYGSPYGTGYGSSYGMGHGGYRYPYGYGAGCSLRAMWTTVTVVIMACLLFTKYSS
ncbi:uncharacterized protein LOC135401430 isoform X2 [Ornithodoros turicata]|uniref:uncharacterized protein LOC135401430 isoform X2 n=1 Tax=Ornithodoros turicata TaxID=34597 RepID=UPI00313880C1